MNKPLFQEIEKNTKCPECSAEKGQFCVTVANYKRNPHQRRISLYLKENPQPKCGCGCGCHGH